MKKYFKPTIETVELEIKWALCGEGSNPSGVGVKDDTPGGAGGRDDAPRRRVF